MGDDWAGEERHFKRQAWRDETHKKLEYYESEYWKLKEMISLLELALWKARISSLAIDNEKMKLIQKGHGEWAEAMQPVC